VYCTTKNTFFKTGNINKKNPTFFDAGATRISRTRNDDNDANALTCATRFSVVKMKIRAIERARFRAGRRRRRRRVKVVGDIARPEGFVYDCLLFFVSRAYTVIKRDEGGDEGKK